MRLITSFPLAATVLASIKLPLLGNGHGTARKLYPLDLPKDVLTPSATWAPCAKNPWVTLHENSQFAHKRVPLRSVITEDIGDAWDWRNVSGVSYVTRTLNQHIPTYCGSCWAHAASSSFGDRIKILRRAAWPDIDISVQYSLNCLTQAGTCFGGSDLELYALFGSNGVPDETCQVYVAKDHKCSKKNQCRNCFGPPGESHCFPQRRYAIFKADDFGYIQNPDIDPTRFATYRKALGMFGETRRRSNGTETKDNNLKKMIQSMKAEIKSNGPISCVVDAETMFEYYMPLGGDLVVLDDIPGKEINHVISVAGWDRDSTGKEYWIVRNSWGTYWGDAGWAYIATGKNNAFIESFCSFVIPQWPPTIVDHSDDEKMGNSVFDRELDLLVTNDGGQSVNDVPSGESDTPHRLNLFERKSNGEVHIEDI